MDRFGTAFDDLPVREERVERGDRHAEGAGLRADQAADVAVSLDAEALPRELAARRGRELGPGHEDHHREGEFRHGVGILAGGIHHHDAAGRSGGEVDIVIAGAGTDDNPQLRRGGDHLRGHLVRADDHRLRIGRGGLEVRLLRIFFQPDHLVPGLRENPGNPLHRLRGKGLLRC